jgi:hypothetical protein
VFEMAVSNQTDFWTARLNGQDPANPVGDNNTAWALDAGDAGDGASSNGYWRITSALGGQTWKQTVADADNDLTLMCAVHIESVSDADEVLMALDNGTHRIEVQSVGDLHKVKLVGTTTVESPNLDFAMGEETAVPIILRLTLANDGTARLYMAEIIEDDDAQQHYLEVSAQTTSAQGAFFGTTTGTVDFYSVYFTPHGAYSPDEMDMSDFISHSLLRTGMKVRDILRNSNRLFLKTHVGSAGINYAFDLSSESMLNRYQSPTVHVMIQKTNSPDFLTLAGTRTDQRYTVVIFVSARGTNYENAYRLAASILGEVFDELYVQTGLQSGVDSLIGYDATFDTKVDEDDVVCIHTLSLEYMKKIRMFYREA